MPRFSQFIRDLPSQPERIKELYKDGSINFAAKTVSFRRKVHTAMGLSTLDIIACGLGAVAFIAILNMLIKTPIPPPLSEDFILAEIQSNQSGVFGFAVRHDYGEWIYINQQKTKLASEKESPAADLGLIAADYVYSVGVESCEDPYSLEGCEHTVAHLLLHKPAVGRWEIEPFFSAFRSERGINKARALNSIQCFYWTREKEYFDSEQNCSNQDLSAPAKRPGIFVTEITH